MKSVLSCIICIATFSIMLGQTQLKDSISGGSYTISADPMIESLVQNATKAKCYTPEPTRPKFDNASTKVMDPCAGSQKVMGYKIQIMYTKDRNAATRAKTEFARSYPGLVPELIYTQPDYRVIVGEYFTKRSAASDLNSVQRNYPGAFLVQWRVWCRKAK